MSELYYSTESEEHLTNIGDKDDDQWDELTRIEMEEDLLDSWDLHHPCYTSEELEEEDYDAARLNTI